MPTNRKRTPRSRKIPSLNKGEINWLYDRDDPLENKWTDCLFMTKEGREALWSHNRKDVIEWWIENRPCTRPQRWWEYDAPKQLVAGCDSSEHCAHQAFRTRIGGIGTPDHEALSVLPSHILGIPASWDWHGAGLADSIDPDNPPLYESQAAYLRRHSILTPGELNHLRRHPQLLEPDRVLPEEPEE